MTVIYSFTFSLHQEQIKLTFQSSYRGYKLTGNIAEKTKNYHINFKNLAQPVLFAQAHSFLHYHFETT